MLVSSRHYCRYYRGGQYERVQRAKGTKTSAGRAAATAAAETGAAAADTHTHTRTNTDDATQAWSRSRRGVKFDHSVTGAVKARIKVDWDTGLRVFGACQRLSSTMML